MKSPEQLIIQFLQQFTDLPSNSGETREINLQATVLVGSVFEMDLGDGMNIEDLAKKQNVAAENDALKALRVIGRAINAPWPISHNQVMNIVATCIAEAGAQDLQAREITDAVINADVKNEYYQKMLELREKGELDDNLRGEAIGDWVATEVAEREGAVIGDLITALMTCETIEANKDGNIEEAVENMEQMYIDGCLRLQELQTATG